MTDLPDLFEPADPFPSEAAKERYETLVGLDHIKERLEKEARLLLRPDLLERWSREQHRMVLPIVGAFGDRMPLFVFAGDVGVGKTELAETFGDRIARTEDIAVTLMKMSLNARGTGRVGEMTDLIAQAFRHVETRVAKQRGAERPTAAVILLIDEADALAQSRELAQMHHEDRAGVNALVRGISHIATQRLPVITVLCTNRRSALDPAVERRAAAIFDFVRPNEEQRAAVLREALDGTEITEEQIHDLAKLTGPINGRAYGFTYSDLRTRLIPGVVLDAFPAERVRFERVVELVAETPATKPFETER